MPAGSQMCLGCGPHAGTIFGHDYERTAACWPASVTDLLTDTLRHLTCSKAPSVNRRCAGTSVTGLQTGRGSRAASRQVRYDAYSMHTQSAAHRQLATACTPEQLDLQYALPRHGLRMGRQHVQAANSAFQCILWLMRPLRRPADTSRQPCETGVCTRTFMQWSGEDCLIVWQQPSYARHATCLLYCAGWLVLWRRCWCRVLG